MIDCLDVVIAHTDPESGQLLALSLGRYFRSVTIATTAEELRSAIASKRIPIAVADLDLIGMRGVQQLRNDHGTFIIGIHRIPDESMWAEALGHGAMDCCQTSDIASIIAAVRRDAGLSSHAA